MTPNTAAGSEANERLDVLIVAAFDSTNYAYIELVRELHARGHRATVLVADAHDTTNLAMFRDAGTPVIAIDDYDLSAIERVDFVVTGPFRWPRFRELFNAIERAGTFVIAFANLLTSVTMRVHPDLVITTSERTFDEFADSGLSYSMLAIGNPQYDGLMRTRAEGWRPSEGPRKVLVVEQGAYPFGDTGKSQLADTLLALASHYTSTEFWVKPRYLRHDSGDQLHSLSEHLYDHLSELPPNMKLLEHATTLEEIAPDFDAIVTTWSTGHLAAVALGMPLLLIGGLDSDDVYDVRRQRVERAYRTLETSGCVVDWHDVLASPPEFRPAAEAYDRQMFAAPEVPAAPRVVDVMETVEQHFLSRGELPRGTIRTDYDHFMDLVDELPSVAIKDAATVRMRTYRRRLNDAIQDLSFTDRCMGYQLDMRSLLDLWESDTPSTDDEVETMAAAARRRTTALLDDYFASHAEAVASDPFIQEAFFDHLLATGRHQELRGWNGPLVAEEAWLFDAGSSYVRRGRPFKGLPMIAESFSRSLLTPIRRIKKNRDIRVLLERTDKNLLALVALGLLRAYGKTEALAALDVPARTRSAALASAKAKALMRLGKAEEAGAMLETYLAGAGNELPSGVTGLPGFVARRALRRCQRLTRSLASR